MAAVALLRLMAQLRARREVLGLSQAEVARRIGITRAAMSLIEGGHTFPELPRFVKWAEALDMDLVLKPRPTKPKKEPRP
ncbi:helix-turn-helix domain-containing protein [Nitrospirillum viridazoti]|uniref:HTH cro/C1-type domain-containing protein n=1 Tax=Nitrospirillum viridazoti CBAmc TaxID=1441467 RepID=A0A248JS92_9PROT|nr:helix-turn-helix transcriptional regulator [Nitrospirillum amazonense]ASG21380.1 hypothetical protein Y958_11490 [Nitrospirillum amazonense CBAmc]TWB33056.1 helix-turn-helix protein [Nitrospirillum amazonense]